MSKQKIAIYARISTSTGRQDTESQLNQLREYCKQRGFTVYKEFIDEMSGTRDDRPAFQLLMEEARKRRIDCVLVFRFDRFSRSTKTLIDALEEFRTLGVEFISYSENIDTSTPIGKCMYTIISAFSAMEREIIKERVISGLDNARQKGVVLGAPRKQFDTARAIELKNLGWGCRKIGKLMGVSHMTIFTYLNGVKNTLTSNMAVSVS
jgi:DNA invertase Pin-like site-specific DNA recombinase